MSLTKSSFRTLNTVIWDNDEALAECGGFFAAASLQRSDVMVN